MLSTTRPTGLRFAGFVATVLGGALIAFGSVLTWATVTIGQIGTSNVLPPQDVHGLDQIEGKITLALGAFLLVAIPGMRLTLSRRGRRIWAIGVVAASLVAGGIALSDTVRSFDRFSQTGCDRVARDISNTTHLPFDRLRDQCLTEAQGITDVRLKTGIFLVIVGGVVGALGGAFNIVWAGRPTKPDTADPLEDEDSAASG